MAILDIRKYPDPCLRKRCHAIKAVDSQIRKIFDDMAMTMYSVSGVGLAAPQVGLDIRIIVIDIGQGLLKLANPEIIRGEGVSVLEEGCLSVPGSYVKIKRKQRLTVSALDHYGRPQLIKAEGLLAHAFGQEIDHLNGRLIIDYLPFHRRMFIK
jgi:peptide deformylase